MCSVRLRLRFLPGVSGGIYRTLPAGREGRPALCECPVLCSGPSGLCGDVPRPPGSCRLSLTCLAGTCSWCHVVRVFPLRSLGERAHQPRLAVLFQARLSLARRGVVPPRSLLPLLPGGASGAGSPPPSLLSAAVRGERSYHSHSSYGCFTVSLPLSRTITFLVSLSLPAVNNTVCPFQRSRYVWSPGPRTPCPFYPGKICHS